MSQSIAVLGSDQVPLVYQVPVPGTLTALSASGTYDGTSAADFVPCLSFYDSDGNLLARATAPLVAAGESAEVSWFPRVGGSGGDGWKFDTDNEGGWGLVAANDTGPNGYGLEFSTGSSDAPTGLTGDGGLTVDTAGAVSIFGGSGITLSATGDTIDVSGCQIVNGTDGTNPTDFATVGQLPVFGGVASLDSITGAVTLVAGANVVITDNTPSAGDITIAATGGGGGGGGEIGYAQITSPVFVTSTTESAGTTIIAPGSFTFDGAPVIVTFSADRVNLPQDTTAGNPNFLVVSLFEGSTQITRLAFALLAQSLGTGFFTGQMPVCGQYRFAPTAGAHTYKITAHVSSTIGTPNVQAGAGGTATDAPAFVRFVKV